MSFHDVVLPPGIQYGSAAGAGFATIIQPSASGHETRITQQAQGRHRLSLVKALQTSAEAQVLKSFALERRGAAHSFKVTDVSDFTTNLNGTGAHTEVDVVLGTGNGTNTTFQLLKVYGSINPYVRVLTLPVSGSVLAALNPGGTTTAFTVDGQGRIVFNTAPGNGVVVTAGCQFYVPVRFGQGFDQWAALQADAFDTWSLPQLDVIEVLNEVEMPERLVPDGGRDWGSMGASFRVAFNDGNLQYVNPTTAISMVLPAPAGCPGGRNIFTAAVYAGAAGSLQVRDDAGNAVGSALTAGQVKAIGLAINSTNGATWVIG